MEPTEKSVEVDSTISILAGKDRKETIRQSMCMLCHKQATKFKDQLSKREYTISGMCQLCQDGVFGASS